MWMALIAREELFSVLLLLRDLPLWFRWVNLVKPSYLQFSFRSYWIEAWMSNIEIMPVCVFPFFIPPHFDSPCIQTQAGVLSTMLPLKGTLRLSNFLEMQGTNCATLFQLLMMCCNNILQPLRESAVQVMFIMQLHHSCSLFTVRAHCSLFTVRAHCSLFTVHSQSGTRHD